MKSESGGIDLLEYHHSIAAQEDILVLQVYGYPVVDDNIDIKIDETDLKSIHTSSGAGGQHVNTTDSAVRYSSAVKNCSAMSK